MKIDRELDKTFETETKIVDQYELKKLEQFNLSVSNSWIQL